MIDLVRFDELLAAYSFGKKILYFDEMTTSLWEQKANKTWQLKGRSIPFALPLTRGKSVTVMGILTSEGEFMVDFYPKTNTVCVFNYFQELAQRFQAAGDCPAGRARG